MKKNILCLFIFITFPFIGNAKVFKNSYIRFKMPDTWACETKKTAWLCRYKISKSCKKDPSPSVCKEEIKKSREAVIVLAAKEKSKIDSLENYKNHLNEIRSLKLPDGSSTQSKVIHGKKVGIKKHQWVDGMHLGSELPHYYTRYLATIKGDISVLVTFTAHKLFYTKYSNQFFKSIKSLEVTATQASQVKKSELGKPVLSRPIDIPDELFGDMGAREPVQGDSLSTLLFILAMALAGVGVFIWFKSRR